MTRRDVAILLIALVCMVSGPHVIGTWWGVLLIAVSFVLVMVIALSAPPASREERLRQRRRFRDRRTSWSWNEDWRWSD